MPLLGGMNSIEGCRYVILQDMDADLYNLEFLSLVAKITQEIDNYTGLNDKDLAEFIIALHDKSNKSISAFKEKLNELEANFPDSLVENVDRLILSMHPKHKKKQKSACTDGKVVNGQDGMLSEQEKQKRMFPGLALQNKDVPSAVSDDVFLEELGDLVSGKKRPPSREGHRSPKRQRRSPSPRRPSPSPPRGRGYGDRGRDSVRYGRRNGASMDDRPVLFKIYDGRVSGLKEFGAFVTLEGVMGRVEGERASPMTYLHRADLSPKAWYMYPTFKQVLGQIRPLISFLEGNQLKLRS